MSLSEPRCLVCGAPLDKGAPFEKDVRNSEVCSDKCYDIYMNDEDKEVNEAFDNHVGAAVRDLRKDIS